MQQWQALRVCCGVQHSSLPAFLLPDSNEASKAQIVQFFCLQSERPLTASMMHA